MDAWVIWAIVAVALAIAEVLTLTFVLAMTSVGALAAAIAAAAGVPAIGQWIIFGATAVVLLVAVLPIARRHLRTPPAIRSGAARIVGTRVMSISPITTAEGGRVRINGEAWSARPDIDGYVIPAGQWVNVVKIDGATAIVHPTTEPIA
ncbi:MAG TPA: NfeD family protein [Mycobacteriales bacterium]|nr:NfeD family protein [Mycobacteriales bacterium]